MAEFKFFIIPRGRTGGTLLATMLNAHPHVSMGYEIYPDLLVANGGQAFAIAGLLDRLHAARKRDNEAWAKKLARDGFRVFVARARRSGIEPQALCDCLEEFASNDRTLDSLDDRLDFIDALLQGQARHAGKPFVGSKMRVDPDVLYARHPNAIYLMMLRDGRDVLDSRLKVGNFKTSPADCARQWCEDLAGFEDFLTQSGANGTLVRYEDLVADPKAIMEPVMSRAGLRYDPTMADFAGARQPLFQNAHGHLSAKQLSGGMSQSSIGRWRSGLNNDQLAEFMSVAGGAMARHGYA